MEIINTHNLKEDLGPQSINTVPLAPVYQKVGRINFLRKIYSYPPKIKIIAPPNKDSADHLKNSNKILQINESASNVKSFVLNKTKQRFASNFYAKQGKVLKPTLQSIPVYAVLNGRQEIVLAHHPLNDFFANPANRDRNLDLFESSPPNEQLKPNFNLGIFFFDFRDAEMYLSNVIKADPKDAKRFGLSVHCVGLDSAYKLIRSYHPDTEFRFLPSLDELSFFLDNKLESPQNLTQYNSQATNPPFSLKAFQGVPAYIVRINKAENKQILLLKPFHYLQAAVKAVDKQACQFYRYLNPQQWFDGRPMQVGSLSLPTNKKDYKNMVFFRYADAEAFCSDNADKIVSAQTGQGGLLKGAPFLYKPKIYVTNLEDLLEEWENSAFKHKLNANFAPNPTSFFNVGNTVFLPSSTQNSNFLNQADHNTSSFKENLKVKWNILAGLVADFCSGN